VLKVPEREENCSPLYSSEVNNEWSFNSDLPHLYVSMAWARTLRFTIPLGV